MFERELRTAMSIERVVKEGERNPDVAAGMVAAIADYILEKSKCPRWTPYGPFARAVFGELEGVADKLTQMKLHPRSDV
jgi:hypothetical protein